MSKANLITFIQLHLPASLQVIKDIAGEFEEKQFLRNSYFVQEGSYSNEYLFLENGFMRAFTMDTEGNDVTTNFYSRQNIVFEVDSFFNRSRSRENIQALTDCEGYVLSFEQLNKLFHSIPEFREFGRAMLVKGFVALKQRTLSLINKTAEERYIDLIQQKAEIFQHAPLKHIASYLGITDSSLSRIRREFSTK